MEKMLSLHFLFAVILFTITVYGNTENTSTREKYKVIIVGAGISGMGAATRLLSNNFSDITILEASNRLGGRVYTAPFGDYLIEYGAQWVHGQGGNPVYEIAEPYNFLYIQNWEIIKGFVKHSDSKLNISVVSSWLFDEVGDIFYNKNDMMLCNCSVEHYFTNKFNELIKNNNIDQYTAQAVADYATKYQRIQDGVSNLDEEGSWGSVQHFQYNGSLSVAWKTGYHSFINMLMGKYKGKELPVEQKTKFNKVVQTISWTGNEVKICCEDGSHYFADHVIVTVSLGVLKVLAKTMFNPSLPDNKLAAIEGGWTTEVVDFHFVENQPRVLEGWVIGDTARLMETLSNDELTGAVTELFNWFVSNEYSISKPINITRSTWGSNRFIHGSYSFRTVKSDRLGYSAANILAEPLLFNQTNPVVLFAGEATNDKSFATVHGALETGWREATRILSF
ncbi:spermine oxidase-like isoform X4 [Lycorma delicatula]|uniref:spermine oxidase-like isoform X4 n=1 Tax=Lycorma delicatula TaxID=130591 RepID=UPI003F51825B